MNEIWKDIKGYEGSYQVSNFGRVKSLDRYVQTSINPTGKRLIKGKILKQVDWNQYNGGGYYGVNLSKNNQDKHRMVHRLVAEAFISNPNNLPFINHKDEDKHNNHVDNLEWCTVSYNNSYGTARHRGGMKKAKTVLKFDLNGVLLKRYDNLHIAATEENVQIGNLANVCVKRNGKLTLNGYVFMYEEDYKKNGFNKYKNPKTKMINQYDLNGKFIKTFNSIKEAGDSIPNISKNGQANITAVCKYRQNYAYGYIWRYTDEVDSNDDLENGLNNIV